MRIGKNIDRRSFEVVKRLKSFRGGCGVEVGAEGGIAEGLESAELDIVVAMLG